MEGFNFKGLIKLALTTDIAPVFKVIHSRDMLLGVVLVVAVFFAVATFTLYRRLKNSKRSTGEKEYKLQLLYSNVKDYEARLIVLADQNKWLVTEIHHRVKNSLQIMNSLINSQLSYVKNPDGRKALTSSRHRLYAISLVHQKLFQSSKVTTMPLACYIAELVTYLSDEYEMQGRVKFKFDMIPVSLDINLAIPLGLIINEVISNTLKFAFPAGTIGNASITLIQQHGDNYRLIFADDGIGFPEDYDINTKSSLGSSLIAGLTRQIKAKINIQGKNGAAVTLDFKAPQAAQFHLAAS